MANIATIDLNLLRLFDAIYRTRNVSRAADELGLSQSAASQALTRLRLLLCDHLFERALGGVKPTERADRLARAVQEALAMLATALQDREFDPKTSRAELRLHLTDIGEVRFLPRLMDCLQKSAPNLVVKTSSWASSEICDALDSGQLHLAIGYLPEVNNTIKAELISDKYILVLRAGHPLAEKVANGQAFLQVLKRLQYVAVRSHSDTLRILQMLELEHRIRLFTSSFLALPAIVRSTDMAVLVPKGIAMDFDPSNRICIIDPQLPMRNFTVSMHWSRRFEDDPLRRWVRGEIIQLFRSHPLS